jgi:hypothetical protein
MAATNDSTRYARIAKETSFGVAPAFTLTISGTPSGTFTLTWNGLTTATISATAAPAAVQSALEALSGVGAGNAPCSGTLAAGMTVALVGYRGALVLTADFSLTVATTKTLTGGPQYTVCKLKSVGHEPKLNMELAEEIRNAPDMLYEDSVANGGATEEWDFAGKLRPDQLPLYIAAVGFADTVATAAGESAVWVHTQKPSNPGTTYSVQVYDGQAAWVGTGFTGTDLELKGTAGETGSYDFTLKGWSKKAQRVSPPATVVLPGNTGYKMLKPANTGVVAQLNGVTSSLVMDWGIKWQREAKPKFTQIGGVDPYRAEFGKRQTDFNADLLFDDTTEVDAALAVPQLSRSFSLLMPGIESLGVVPTKPAFKVTIPRSIYDKVKVDSSGASPKVSLSGKTLYDTASAAQVRFDTTNEVSTAY